MSLVFCVLLAAAAPGIVDIQASMEVTDDQRRRIDQNRSDALRRRRSRSTGIRIPDLPSGWIIPSLPLRPNDFTEICELQAPAPLLLAKLNAHDRDRVLSFDGPTHTYYINGVPTLGSVTGLIRRFSEPFDADVIIEAMVKGKRWPRPGYLKSVLSTEVAALIGFCPAGEVIVHEFTAPCRDEEHICELAKAIAFTDTCRVDIVEAISLSPADIKHKWDANRIEAANLGTWMHLQFELFLNRIPVDKNTSEMQLFLKWVGEQKGLTAYRTEWMIYGEEEQLAGSIDFVAVDEQGRLVLFDWKRSKGLRSKYENQFRNMQRFLGHLEDCSGNHYRLQLNCYCYLIEKYYRKAVAGMFVVCTHPDNEMQAFVDEVPKMDKEVKDLMEDQRLLVASSRIDGSSAPEFTEDMWGGPDEDLDAMLAIEREFQESCV